MVLSESLKTAREQFLVNGKIPLNVFEQLVKLDISNTYKYISKICELYTLGIPISKIEEVIIDYDKYQIKMDDKDIYHKNFNQIVSDIKIAKYELENSIKNTKKQEKQRNRIYFENNISIYEITSFYDAYKKGIGTNWCISYNEMWFKTHTINNHEKFLIIHNDNLKFEDQNSRLCFSYIIFEDYTEITIYNKYNYEYLEYSLELKKCIDELGDVWTFILDYIKK